jgi:hypothetical protein
LDRAAFAEAAESGEALSDDKAIALGLAVADDLERGGRLVGPPPDPARSPAAARSPVPPAEDAPLLE